MRRKERGAEEQSRRAKIQELLELSQVSSMEDIQNLFKEILAEFMEYGLDVELSGALGYNKYNYRNKETDNSRNGHEPVLGKWMCQCPGIGKGSLSRSC